MLFFPVWPNMNLARFIPSCNMQYGELMWDPEIVLLGIELSASQPLWPSTTSHIPAIHKPWKTTTNHWNPTQTSLWIRRFLLASLSCSATFFSWIRVFSNPKWLLSFLKERHRYLSTAKALFSTGRFLGICSIRLQGRSVANFASWLFYPLYFRLGLSQQEHCSWVFLFLHFFFCEGSFNLLLLGTLNLLAG